MMLSLALLAAASVAMLLREISDRADMISERADELSRQTAEMSADLADISRQVTLLASRPDPDTSL